MRRFTWRPDPPSSKDWTAEPLLARITTTTLPARVRWDNQIVDILDQGNLGSCVANALAQAIRATLIRLSLPAAVASRLYLYYMARANDGTVREDAGTYLRSALDGARRVGYPAERFWPYDDGPEMFKMQPSGNAARLAYDQKAGLSYHKVLSTGAQRSCDLRALLAAGHVVVFGTQVTNKFRDYTITSAPLEPPKGGETVLGGHALLLGGYGPGYFEGVNSWGPGYGWNGWFQMTDAYIEDPRSSDFWVLDNVAPFSEV